MTVPIRSMGDNRYELYRVILDYEALQDGFLDRADDLNMSLTEIDAVGGMTRGNAQKLLSKKPGKMRSDKPNTVSRRTFGPQTLGKMLKGTKMVLALMVDTQVPDIDAKPRHMRGGAVLLRRKREAARREGSASMLNPQETQQTSEQLASLEKFKMWGAMGGKASAKRRMKVMKKRARQRIASHAARKRWEKVRCST